MAIKTLKAISRLRRDNDYNYEKIKNSFIPANGEVCLVDTSDSGLCAIVGDGVTKYADLKYENLIFETIDVKNLDGVQLSKNKIYINENDLFYFNGIELVPIFSPATANAEQAGVLKMYDTLGDNIDGTMTQRSITENLNLKVSASVEIEEELAIFE